MGDDAMNQPTGDSAAAADDDRSAHDRRVFPGMDQARALSAPGCAGTVPQVGRVLTMNRCRQAAQVVTQCGLKCQGSVL